MTTLRVSLNVVVDDSDERLCSGSCPFLGARGSDTICELTSPHWLKLSGDRFAWLRTESCKNAVALAAADDTVLEAGETWGRDMHDIADRGLPPRSWDVPLLGTIDARSKLRATSGKEKP